MALEILQLGLGLLMMVSWLKQTLWTSIQKKNASEVYDEETVSTYLYAGTDWIGYDGPISTGNKVKFAREQGLGGYLSGPLEMTRTGPSLKQVCFCQF